ncbi:MAG: archease [Spirochaetales bacterium]|nr:archease [Spirochaetales bacterium]
MKQYRFIENLTSDIMFEAFGATLEELFEASALALFSIVCDIKRVKQEQSFTFEVTAENTGNLLHDFLSTLLTQSEIRGMFFNKFTITSLIQTERESTLTAKAEGEAISPEKGGTVVKGITFYGFRLEKKGNGFRAQVAMDI